MPWSPNQEHCQTRRSLDLHPVFQATRGSTRGHETLSPTGRVLLQEDSLKQYNEIDLSLAVCLSENLAMNPKLHINLTDGVVDIEGDADLIREVYADFKGHLLDRMESASNRSKQDNSVTQKPDNPPTPKRRPSKKKVVKPVGDEKTIDPKNPKLDKNLDLSGLPKFYRDFLPKNHPERILIFAKFLIDELKIEQPNTDQFYSCFDALNEKIPTAFQQAFRDAHGRHYGYIEYGSPTQISVPIKGTNHFRSGIKKKSPK